MKFYICVLMVFFNGFVAISQNKISQEHCSDTLFFQYEIDYLKKGKYAENQIYIIDALEDKGSSETFFFKVEDVRDNMEPKKILSLKNFIRNSKFYSVEKDKNKFDDFQLSKYLQNFIIFLEIPDSKSGEFLKVSAMTVID